MRQRIVIIEDESDIVEMVRYNFRKEGFEVESHTRGKDGLEALRRNPPDLLLLDIMLPDQDGLTICRQLRGDGRLKSLPVVFLTARGEEVDRIVGLEIGADDYVVKPFSPRELVARVKAVMRRKAPAGPPGAPAAGGVHQFGEFSFNLATRTLTRAGKAVPLTTGEFSVLKVLVQHPRQPLSRDKLMELARGREYEVFDRSIDVQISRLRKIVERDPAHPKHIQTVWGFGYVFVPDVESK